MLVGASPPPPPPPPPPPNIHACMCVCYYADIIIPISWMGKEERGRGEGRSRKDWEKVDQGCITIKSQMTFN